MTRKSQAAAFPSFCACGAVGELCLPVARPRPAYLATVLGMTAR